MKKTYNPASRKPAPTSKKKNSILFIAFFTFLSVLVISSFVGYRTYLYSGISQIDTSINFENQLFANASFNYYIPTNYIDSTINLKQVSYETLETGEPYYHFEFSGYDQPQGFMCGDVFGDDAKYENVHETVTLKNFSKRHELMIESARNFVIEYIKDSNVLTDKEILIERIKNLPIYLYTDCTHEIIGSLDAPAVHTGKAIYFNYDYKDFFCEFIFVHEMVHNLRYITTGDSFSNMRYFATALDETITDLITYSMSPKFISSTEYASGYMEYYEPVNKYLHIFGEDALYAYFYGYDEFFSRSSTFKTEHNAFVFALEKYPGNLGPIVACETLIKHWDALSTEKVN